MIVAGQGVSLIGFNRSLIENLICADMGSTHNAEMEMNAGFYSGLTDEERIEPAFFSLHHQVTQVRFAELVFSGLDGADFGRVGLDRVNLHQLHGHTRFRWWETRNLYVQSMTSNFTGPSYL